MSKRTRDAWGSSTGGGSSKGPKGSERRARERRRQQMLAKLSGGDWNSGGNSKSMELPSYNASDDKNCPFTQTPAFQQKLKRIKRREKEQKMRQSHSAGLMTVNSSMINPSSNSMCATSKSASLRDTGSLTGGQVSSMSTPSGGITQQRAESQDPSTELEVLKCILLREGYLKRLRDLGVNAGSSGLRVEVVDVLDLLRVATVDTVEAIQRWRDAQAKPYPFVWNGINYLVKIPSDLDFLDEIVPLTSWLGFNLLRNPFVVPNPMPLEQMSKQPSYSSTVDHSIHPALSPPKVKGPGGVPVSDFQQPSIHAGTNHDPTLAAVDNDYVKIGGHPVIVPTGSDGQNRNTPKDPTGSVYKAPILNDADMQVGLQGRPRRKHRLGGRRGGPSGSAMPSMIGDLDMSRVRRCEEQILSEEGMYGRFMRDRSGRIMPESQARKANFAATLAQYQDNPSPGTYDIGERNGGAPTGMGMGMGGAHAVGPAGRELAERSGPVGSQRAKKKGGMLEPLSKTGPNKGRKQAPKMLGRGARMENDLARARKENERLGGELRDVLAQLQDAMELLLDMQMAGPEDEITPARVREQEALVAQLKGQVEQMQTLLSKREADAARKEEMRNHIKKSQAQHLTKRRQQALERKRKQLGEGEVQEEDEDAAVTLENLSATEIQKIARGVHAREYVQQRRIRYNYAATMIQAGARGYFDRSFVRRKRMEHAAAVALQRLARGVQGRTIANRKRHARLVAFAATEIQKMWRAMMGRMRMRAKQTLMSYTALANEVALTVFPSQILELSDACTPSNRRPPPPATVLALVQAIMLFTARRGEKYTKMVPSLGWDEAAKFLRRSQKLVRRIRACAAASSHKLLRVPKAGIDLVRAYAHEPMWSPDEMEKIGAGGVACKKLFEWLLAVLKVVSVQEQFVESELDWPEGEEFWEQEGELEQRADRAEDRMCQAEEVELERQYIPPDLLLAYRKRPRPLLIALARDVPSFSKRRMVERLMGDMPSVFVRVNLANIDVPAVQAILDLGNSVVLDVDIGLGAAQRRAFLSAFTTAKRALVPTPLCLLVCGSSVNRHGSGAEQKIGVSQDDLELMSDKPLKMALEEQAESFQPIRDGSLSQLMFRLAHRTDPPSSLVLVLEAVIVLLTPNKRFKGPGFSTRSVAWEAGRRLLARPADLTKRLSRFNTDKVPAENLLALQKYMDHPEWPTSGRLNAKGDNLVVAVLVVLGRWVTAVIRYCELLADQGGAPPAISRRYPAGLFASTVIVRDPEHDCHGFQDGDHTGWGNAYLNLLGPLLEDVRVYRESRKIGGRYLTVNVYRDCNRFFFAAYEPGTSMLRYTVLEQKEVNNLLAPNSMEIRGGRFSEPPRSTLDMYQRLVRLCQLEVFREKGVKRAPQTVLVCRREMVCLLQESRRIQGHFAVLTVSERARGELFITAYIPKFSARLDLPITATLIRDVMPDTDKEERKLWDSGDAAQMLVPAVDRLELFHPSKSSASLGTSDKFHKTQRNFGYKMRLRTAGGGGRLVLKRSIRLGHGLGKKVLHLVEMFESGEGGPLRLNVYNPMGSQKFEIPLSSRERVDLINGSISDYARWAPALLERLQVKGAAKGKGKGAQNQNPKGKGKGAGMRVILDKTLHTHSLKVVSTDPIDPANPSKTPETHKMLLTVRAKLGGAEGGVCLEVYHYVASKQWTLLLTDSQLQAHIRVASTTGTEDAEEWEWPTADPTMRVDVLEHLAGSLQWRKAADTMSVGLTERDAATGQTLPIVVGKRTDRVAVAMEEKQRLAEIARQKDDILMLAADGSAGGKKAKLGDGRGNIAAGQLKNKPLPLEKSLVDPEEEEMVLNSAFKVHTKPRPSETKASHTHVMVKAFHHTSKEFHYRFAIYNPGSGAKAETHVRGQHDLREILGPAQQELLEPSLQPELLDHLIHNCVTLVPGTWDDEKEAYDTEADPSSFSAVMHRTRLYGGEKVTHTHKMGDEDQKYQEKLLIDRKDLRGFKLLSKTRRMDGFLVTVTAFDATPPSKDKGGSEGEAPSAATPVIRFQGYDSTSSHKTMLFVYGPLLLDTLQIDAGDPVLAPGKEARKALALKIMPLLRMRKWRDAPPTLELPWKGEPDGGVWARDQTEDGDKTRFKEERMLARSGKMYGTVIELPGEQVDATGDEPKERNDKVVVSLFEKEEGVRGGSYGLQLNVYDPLTSCAAEVELTSAEVLMALGTQVRQLPEGRVRDFCMRALCAQLRLQWGHHFDGRISLGAVIDLETIKNIKVVEQAEVEDDGEVPVTDDPEEDEEIPTSAESAAAKADFDDLPANNLLREGRKLGDYYAQVKVIAGENYNIEVYAWSNGLTKLLKATFSPDQLRTRINQTDERPSSQVELAQFVTKSLAIIEKDGEYALDFPDEHPHPEA